MDPITRQATYVRFHDMPPSLEEASSGSHWVTRGSNFVVVVTHAKAGTRLARTAQPDEYMVILPEDVGAKFTATSSAGQLETFSSPGDSLTIVPPGDSSVTVEQTGYVYRVFTNLATDLLPLASNAAAYADGVPDVAPMEPWPAPPDGFRLRTYKLADYIKEGTTTRLFRSTNLMVNIFVKQTKARDITKMTPHFHDDFEQASLAIMGRYVHHLRYPWTPDMTTWRQDDHGEVGSPSVIIIPPNVIHTTQAFGTDPTRLVDIFSPPRADFSKKPGLVINADEYPMPESLR